MYEELYIVILAFKAFCNKGERINNYIRKILEIIYSFTNRTKIIAHQIDKTE